MATFEQVNDAYNAIADRYQTIESRGAGRKYPTEMDLVRTKIVSIGRAWPKYVSANDPDRLLDIVVNEGVKIKKILDQIESAFPPGTMVLPGSTGEKDRLKLYDLQIVTPGQLESEAPPGIGMEKLSDLIQIGPSGWFIAGIDMRWIAGVVFGLGALNFFWRRRK